MERQFSLYIVPTPIGNLKDFSLRAIEILKQTDVIACEDSRVTKKLLEHYEIKTNYLSYHKFNEKERCSMILDLIKSGKQVALVSDAGTPLICDPGCILLTELRKENVEITALPGACAIPTFLSQVPRENDFFIFTGFLPKNNSQIQEIFTKYKSINTVFYESPNRILKTINLIKTFRPNAKIAIGRELSKRFEEILIDDIDTIIKKLTEIKGEIVAMVYADNTKSYDIDLEQKILTLKNKGFKSKEIATIISELFEVNKKEVYNLAINLEQT